MTEPKIRFKAGDGSAFPDWEEKSLSEIFTERAETSVISDNAPLLSFTIEQGVINPEDKKSNKRDFLMKDKESKKFAVTELNDIIYNPANLKFGAIHRNKLGRGVVSPIYAIFHTEQNPVFMEHVVRNPAFIKKSLTFLEGTVEKLKTLKPRDFLRMQVFIPSLPEQQKIADFLSNVDEVIAASEEEVANLEQQKKAVMQKIFSQEVRFKKEDGSDFPDWEEKQLGDIVGKISSGKDKASQGTAILYGSMGPIGTCDNATCCGRKILIARVGANAGTANIVNVDCGVSDNTLIIIDKGYCCLDWLFFCFCYMDVGKMRFGGGQPLVTGSMLRSLQIKFPSLPEQQLIADFLTSYDEAITAAKQELEKWKELKKGLLQQMFV